MPRITGFYSYKGGVGRSMALAHCAVEWARRGRKVLIIDLDLEAPGQHCTNLFKDAFLGQQPTQRLGFVDFCNDFAKRIENGLPELQGYIVRSTEELRSELDGISASGELYLMPAGDICTGGRYRETLAAFSWDKAMNPGFKALAHLKEECERLGFDEVLIDSRTGDADPFYVVSFELAHVLVMVSGYNRQNLLGTQAQMALLDNHPFSRRPAKPLLVLSPKPLGFDGSDDGYWRSHIRPVAAALPEPDVELPYDKRLALSEDMLLEDLLHGKEGYARSIAKLVNAIERPTSVQQPTSVLTTLVNPFSVIRADYVSNSELTRFFVDPGEAVTRALRDFMPVMVYGNRGTGKTMLAKHFAYETALADLRQDATPKDLPQQVGLYLRLDLDLLNTFNTRDEKLRSQFDLLFVNFFDLLVLKKALSALESFGGLSAWCDPQRLFRLLYREFDEGERANSPEQLTLDAFLDFVDEHFSRIRRYFNAPLHLRSPFKTQSNILMKLLVDVLLADAKQNFAERWFAVLVDEVEHFETYQQKVLNSRIKQMKFNDRITFRYFLRHEGLRTQATVVSASKEDQYQIIQESHDFRALKLDEGILADQFEKHVRQIATRQLSLQPQVGRILLAEEQRDLAQLLESWTPEQEAQRLVARSKREDKIKSWLQTQKFKLSPQFWDWYAQQDNAVLRRVVAVFLIHQGKDADAVATAFTAWNEQARNWYHNYHRAALFWLCRQYSANKLYGGLNDVLMLSGQNVRYFLEYLRAIVDHWLADASHSQGLQLPIPVEVQDKAIRARAQFYIDDLRGKPRYAEEMLNIVNRLGSIFAEMHGSLRQSQFEVNHFSIADLGPNATKDLKDWLRECRMENVLLRRPGNKQKSLRDDRLDEWVLHPCFAPYFNISLRRKKKLDSLSSADVRLLFKGNEAEFKSLSARLSKARKTSDNASETDGLFDVTDDDATDS